MQYVGHMYCVCVMQHVGQTPLKVEVVLLPLE